MKCIKNLLLNSILSNDIHKILNWIHIDDYTERMLRDNRCNHSLKLSILRKELERHFDVEGLRFIQKLI